MIFAGIPTSKVSLACTDNEHFPTHCLNVNIELTGFIKLEEYVNFIFQMYVCQVKLMGLCGSGEESRTRELNTNKIV